MGGKIRHNEINISRELLIIVSKNANLKNINCVLVVGPYNTADDLLVLTLS